MDRTAAYDLLVSMPPPLHCAKAKSDSDFANAYIDEKAKMLKQAFATAKGLMKKEGHFVLLFSTVGEVLGINRKDIVKQLCEEHGLKIAKETRKVRKNYEFLPPDFAEAVGGAEAVLFDIQHK
ncbi:MAG: hypothetical protein P4M11_12365 [Candidatus Pacebacteria bacterium]|nr:hypothetical protein [Candidatus Paceibacterota bacterium]